MGLETILPKLLELGGQAGIYAVALFYLARQIKNMYEARIVTLEKSTEECAKDRTALHDKIHEMDRARIAYLERANPSSPSS
jgi:hypothetical protein